MADENPVQGTPLKVLALAASILLLSASEIYRLYLIEAESALLSRIAFLALGVTLVPFFTLREWAMTVLAVVLSLAIWLSGDSGDIMHALDRAAFFGAFIYLVTLLKEAAQRSRSVLALGTYMTQQPQGRRYYSLSIGGHILGVLLNFGAISLLTPLIQRGSKTKMAQVELGQPPEVQLEQQQISALLRGFSWMIMWSPTALTQAVLFTSIPGASASIVVPLGIGASLFMILIGRAVDLYEWRYFLRPAAITKEPLFPTSSAKRFSFICVGLVSTTFGVVFASEVNAAIALMLVAPAMMLVWVYSQQFSADQTHASRTTISVIHEILIRSARHPAQSAYLLGIAGYIGVVAAAIAPVGEFANFLEDNELPTWVFLSSLPIFIILGGQIALSPILVVVFLAAVINELPTLPADPNLIIFALGAGWALSMTSSPNASATLLVSSITRIAPTTLTWRWNGGYATICFLAFTLSFILLS